jgi:hypothetical protein
MINVGPNSAHRGSETPEVFLCHASEDKGFIRDLATTLKSRGISVWVDEEGIRLGDSLPARVGQALARCDFAVPVVSPSFLRKTWPCRELYSLTYREVQTGRTIVLPVLKGVRHSDFAQAFPLLADHRTVNADRGLATVADEIAHAIFDPDGQMAADLKDRVRVAVTSPWQGTARRDSNGTPRCRRCGERLLDGERGGTICEACGLVSTL